MIRNLFQREKEESDDQGECDVSVYNRPYRYESTDSHFHYTLRKYLHGCTQTPSLKEASRFCQIHSVDLTN
jgi:hypothetical protein